MEISIESSTEDLTESNVGSTADPSTEQFNSETTTKPETTTTTKKPITTTTSSEYSTTSQEIVIKPTTPTSITVAIDCNLNSQAGTCSSQLSLNLLSSPSALLDYVDSFKVPNSAFVMKGSKGNLLIIFKN
jgi:hypothetical protein